MSVRQAIVVAVALAGVLAAIGVVGSGVLAVDRSLDELRRTGVIRIGYAVVPPYAFVARGATVTGTSPELARVVTERLGIARIEWVQTEFGSLIDGLEARRFDVIASGMFITPERAARVAFSQPTFRATGGLLVLRGNPRDLHAHEDAIAAPDVRLVVLSGSGEERILRLMGMPDDRLITAPDGLAARRAVEEGAADGLPLSTPAIHWMMRHDRLGATEMAQPFREPELRMARRLGYGGFAFRKEARRLREAWNLELRGYLGSREHLALVAPFGINAGNLPGAVTVDEIIGQP